ncbi:protein kinase family protein [Nocardioides ultimimeridianus]
MSEYVGNLAASLRAGARLEPDEAARAVLPIVADLAAEHARGGVRGSLDPAYVAPEVSAGRRPSPASDVWSVGALLFHSMAGHGPFEHTTETPARLRRAGWLGPMVEMALSPDPGERPSMAEVAAYLRARMAPSSEPEPSIPVVLAESADVAMDGAEPRRRTAMLVLVLGALVVTLGIVAVVLALGRQTDRPAPVAASGPAPATGHHSPTQDAARASETKRAKQPSASELTGFARRYVATASSDPGAGLAMLTAAYQHASPRYREFWTAVSAPRILSVTARPASMSVTYTYRYRLAGRAHTETVTLDLVRRGGRLLIAGGH